MIKTFIDGDEGKIYNLTDFKEMEFKIKQVPKDGAVFVSLNWKNNFDKKKIKVSFPCSAYPYLRVIKRENKMTEEEWASFLSGLTIDFSYILFKEFSEKESFSSREVQNELWNYIQKKHEELIN